MKSYRKDGKIYIEIPEDFLLDGAEFSGNVIFKVTDKERFLNYFVANVLSHGDNGDFDSLPAILNVFNRVIEMAEALGEGIEEEI